MKKLALLSLLVFVGCKHSDMKMPEKTVYDTVFIPSKDAGLKSVIDSLTAKIKSQQEEMENPKSLPMDSILRANDSLKTANNKLGKQLLHKKMIISNALYYLNIVNRNPTQQKFLRGWMNRALNQ